MTRNRHFIFQAIAAIFSFSYKFLSIRRICSCHPRFTCLKFSKTHPKKIDSKILVSAARLQEATDQGFRCNHITCYCRGLRMLAEQFPQEPLQAAAKGAGRAGKRQQCLSGEVASFAAVPRAASERPSLPAPRTLRMRHPQPASTEKRPDLQAFLRSGLHNSSY